MSIAFHSHSGTMLSGNSHPFQTGANIPFRPNYKPHLFFLPFLTGQGEFSIKQSVLFREWAKGNRSRHKGYLSHLYFVFTVASGPTQASSHTYNFPLHGIFLHRFDFGSLAQFIMSTSGHMVSSHSQTFVNCQGLVIIQRLLFKCRIVVSKRSYDITTKNHGFVL